MIGKRHVLLAAILGVAFVNSANAAHLCWIDRVTRVDDGLKIEFAPTIVPNVIGAHRVNANGQRVGIDGRVLPDGSEIGVLKGRQITIELGDTYRMIQGVGNECELDAQVHDGRLGIAASAFAQGLFGRPLNAHEFIYAG